MLQSRKTGKPVPHYLVNVLLRKRFDKIYNINELYKIRISVEIFKKKS